MRSRRHYSMSWGDANVMKVTAYHFASMSRQSTRVPKALNVTQFMVAGCLSDDRY